MPDDADRAALIALLKQAIAADRFPMSARSKLLRSILAKLQSKIPGPGSEPGYTGRASTPVPQRQQSP